MSNTYETREQWLQAAAEKMRPWMAEKDLKIEVKILFSAGWPKYGAPKSIGQCWSPTASDGQTAHIFICPTLGDDPVQVLHILLHEMIHASVGCECGHKGPFSRAAKAMGLQGKPTATYAEPGTPLHGQLEVLAEELGPYPHVILRKPTKKRPAGGGWVKLESVNDPEYILRISPVAAESGMPVDPWGDEMVLSG